MTADTHNITLRIASVDDAEEILKIYTPYVEETAVSFEYKVPSLEEFRTRIHNTLKKYPYILAENNGELLGYTYTGPFVGRAAYDWAAETTIYLKRDKRRMGIGKKLYGALEEISRAQNIFNLNACIGYPETEDKFLTKDSVNFHTHMGYRPVGKFYKCGYKLGTWYHMIWMEKIIAQHPAVPAPVIPFPELDMERVRFIGIK